MKLPDNVDEYIHRAGRAGRMGRAGKSIVLIAPGSNFVMTRYSNEIGIPIIERKLKIKSNTHQIQNKSENI